MAATKSSFLDKVLGRIGRLDTEGLQTVVQRLARERSFLETLFNTIEDGVLVADEARARDLFQPGRHAAHRPAAGRRGSARSRTFCRNWIGRKFPRPTTRAARASCGMNLKCIIRARAFSGSTPRRWTARPTGSSGVALILHDATEARQKTFEAIESERVQALTLLAASVAHEIGNPLNALHIHLQLMEREVKKLKSDEWRRDVAGKLLARHASRCHSDADRRPRKKLEQYLDVAKGEINRLDYIVTQFLGAIRPAPLQLKLVSLNDVVEKTLELLRPEIENRGVTVKTKLARNLTATPVDATQLQQVLVNLVKNAAQAMTTGGTLTLQTGETGDGVWVSVADTGGGIPQEQINRIFEPFYTTKKKGTRPRPDDCPAHRARAQRPDRTGKPRRARHDLSHLAAAA